MRKIDLNCDMAEGRGFDEEIMPFIDAANIACGEHAGDDNIIRDTIKLAINYQVRIGAHPGFADRKNFGRKEVQLNEKELYELVYRQVLKVKKMAELQGSQLSHVKPHGALYNKAAKDRFTAGTIAAAVKDIDPELILFGLSGSALISEGKRAGLKTLSEAFADRSYQDDGTLTPRSDPSALMDDSTRVIEQVTQMVIAGTVTSVSGRRIKVDAETICIHGDGPHAVAFARALARKFRA